ncbi:hypothetical protein MMC18_007029 [Xylographa bjoerkii]|nr:hypothetical protein [Xylographa bjoerkii]
MEPTVPELPASQPAPQPSATTTSASTVESSVSFWEVSRGAKPELWYKFKRFESLALLNLYLYQDELVSLQRDIDYKNGEMLIEQRTRLRTLTKEYYEAMQLFKQTSQLKRPTMAERKKAIKSLQFTLPLTEDTHRDHYRFAADALGMVDLTPQALGVEPDAIRVILGGDDTLANHASNVQTRQPPTTSIFRPLPVGPITDNVARIIMAVFAGALLLVPVIALSYITPTGYRLLATCLFVLAFAVIASVAITGTSNELVGATAAYTAVLVVFLGQTSSAG